MTAEAKIRMSLRKTKPSEAFDEASLEKLKLEISRLPSSYGMQKHACGASNWRRTSPDGACIRASAGSEKLPAFESAESQ